MASKSTTVNKPNENKPALTTSINPTDVILNNDNTRLDLNKNIKQQLQKESESNNRNMPTSDNLTINNDKEVKKISPRQKRLAAVVKSMKQTTDNVATTTESYQINPNNYKTNHSNIIETSKTRNADSKDRFELKETTKTNAPDVKFIHSSISDHVSTTYNNPINNSSITNHEVSKNNYTNNSPSVVTNNSWISF